MIILQRLSYPMTINDYHWFQSQPIELISHFIPIGTSECPSWHRRISSLSQTTMGCWRRTWRTDAHTRIVRWSYPSRNRSCPFRFPTIIQLRQFQRLLRLAPRVLGSFYHDPPPIPHDSVIWGRRRDVHNLHGRHTNPDMEHFIACDPRKLGVVLEQYVRNEWY